MTAEDRQLQSFEIDHPEIDRVAIYEATDDAHHDYYAVPFVHRSEPAWTDGEDIDWYDEPRRFDPDDHYREEVAKHALVPLNRLRLERPTFDPADMAADVFPDDDHLPHDTL